MQESITHVGLDVHKDTIWAALAVPQGEILSIGQIANTAAAVSRLVSKLHRKHPRLHFVYEAGPCGYDLYRQLTAMGFGCEVIAPSLLPRRPGDRIKTDRRDAEVLARLSRGGDLVSVWVPDEHHEAIRELVRCREDFKLAERRMRQRLCAFLLRRSRHYDGSNWTQDHYAWLRRQHFSHAQSQATFDHYLQSAGETGERIMLVERQMSESLEDWSLSPLVDGLMSMRGVSLVTAMTLASELGDMGRFDKASELMSFVGLVPSERSSGLTRHQGGITKSGNAHVRRLLVESAWSCRHSPHISVDLRRRASQTSDLVRSIAWQAQKRLYRRYHRLINRGKASQVAITAVARELAGFVWSINLAVMHPERVCM